MTFPAELHQAASTQAYLSQLPPDLLRHASEYTHGSHWVLLFSALAGVLINLLIIRLGLLARLRKTWERGRPRPWSASLAVLAAYFLLAWLLDLPWALYSKWWREVHYGLSHQTVGAWLSEALINACFSAVLLGVVVTLLYALIRRSPQRWWLWSSALGAAATLSVTLLAPVLIEPAFNDFKPLAEGPGRDAITALADEAGIAARQIVSYDGSKQSSRYTAHVSGVLGTARIAVSDALLSQASAAELRAVVGHEIGHYVLRHELWLALASTILLTLGFWMVHVLYGPLARRLGMRQALPEPDGFPILSIILTLGFLVLTPMSNGVVRLAESQADEYSLAHAQEPDGMAVALLRTADYRAPEPGRLEEWLFYDHPSIARRIGRAMRWKLTASAARSHHQGEKPNE